MLYTHTGGTPAKRISKWTSAIVDTFVLMCLIPPFITHVPKICFTYFSPSLLEGDSEGKEEEEERTKE